MAIDPSIINALIQRPMSVGDYHEQYNRRDAHQALMQRNALLMMQGQQEMQDRQRESEQAEQAQNALMAEVRSMSPGADPRLQALHRLTLAGAMKPAEYVNEAMPRTAGPSRQVVGGSLVEVAPGGRVTELYRPPERPDKPAQPPEIVRLMEYRDNLPPGDPRRNVIDAQIRKSTTHAPAASAVSYGSPVPIMLPDGSIGYAQPGNRPGASPQVMAGPDGKPMTKPAGAEGMPTVEEKGAAGYSARMIEATKLLDTLEKAGRPTYRTDAAGAVPLIGNAARTAAMSPVQQQYRQAQEDWVRAKLRKESGAAIGVDEMSREILTYFPQPGETDPGILEQKRRARAIANEAMLKAAGRAAYKSTVPPSDPGGPNPDGWSIKPKGQ